MAQIVEEALDGILGNMFLTSPPLCTLEELEALMCVSCLAESSRALGTECEVTQPCSTLSDPMDCSLTGSSIHGILQARILEWVAISFSRGSSQAKD